MPMMFSQAIRPTPMSPSAQALPDADIAPTATAMRMSSCSTRLPTARTKVFLALPSR